LKRAEYHNKEWMNMSIEIVLAMHGAPPMDFPKEELTEFFKLHIQMEQMPHEMQEGLRPRYDELEEKVRTWPRTNENDPFYAGANEMALNLQKISNYNVSIGYNEFCYPTLEEAILKAGEHRPDKIIIITPMMTKGGEHAGYDIPKAIEKAKTLVPEVPIIYAWPFDSKDVAEFLFTQVKKNE
jgi:sirohydrochlorin cobaltochelatase